MKLLRASRWFGRSTFRFISRRVPTSDRRQGNGVLGYWGIGVLGYWGAEETPAGTDNNSLPARTSEVSRAE